MRAADTNVLVRLIVGDDARQTRIAEEFSQGGIWISHLVLAETIWVLTSVYERSAAQISATLERLLEQPALSFEQADTLAAALLRFKAQPAVGFSDCLALETARRAGHLPFGTFDRDLSQLEGTQLLG